MTYAVFSQEDAAAPPFEKLAASASRFFSAALELREKSTASISVRLIVSRPELTGDFRIVSRVTTDDDRERARTAESRGRAGGMALLAEKCRHLWTLEATGDATASEAAHLTLAAICASVALGPVLPPDGATLYGVRGAIERRDKALTRA
jgi:hypothetical protein